VKSLRDFECDNCGESEERYIDSVITSYRCQCGGLKQRLIGMPKIDLEGITGAFPGAHAKWARVREENARIKAEKNR
jgi:hypothetical protein